MLVATSIGEEGLDIEQVDCVLSFDCVSASRMTQRMGRTGRKRDGKVNILPLVNKASWNGNPERESRGIAIEHRSTKTDMGE